MRWWIGSLLALAACLLPQNARAEGRWLRAETQRFIVYGEDGQEKLLTAVRDLEALDGLLRRMSATTAPPSPVRLEVYLFKDKKRIEAVWPGGSVFAAGFYMARPDLIAAFSDVSDAERRGDREGARIVSGLGNTVLYHEYAHHFMLQYFANSYPTWYLEGFAEYVGEVKFRNDRIEVGRVPPISASWLVSGEWLPIERFLTGGRGATPEERAQFYAQSWLAVHYLVNTPERMAGFLRYVTALRQGGDPLTAFAPAFGVSVEVFGQELKRYKRAQLVALALTRPAPVASDRIAVTPLPASADTLLLLNARVRMGVNSGDKKQLLADVRAAAAPWPEDPFAQKVIARATIAADEPAAAIPVLDAVLARAPDDAEALYLKGFALVEMSDLPGADTVTLRQQARPLLGRANRLSPNDPHTLFRYAYAASASDAATDESTLNVLLLSQQLAPQVSHYRFSAASVLISRERFDEAVALLRPLAFDAHNAETAAYAKKMMDAAAQRRQVSAADAEQKN